MNKSDERLREQVSRAWQNAAGGGHPAFDELWHAALQQHDNSRQHYRRFASVAAIVAAVVVGLNLQTPTPMGESPYIEMTDLLDSTYWTAPSDALLPEREFDIYHDMPVLFESTEPVGGALL